MPTVAVSSQISEAVYFVAIIGLAVLLARPVYLVYSGAQERSAQALAAGVAEMVDSMRSGTSATFALEAYPGVDISVTLGESTVTAHVGGYSSAANVRWELPGVTLSQGTEYNVTLLGERIEVAAAGSG